MKTKKIKLVATLILALLSVEVFSQNSHTEYHQKIIQYLASDSMQGRGVATFFETKSAEFIKQELGKTKIGNPKYHFFSFVNPITKNEQQSKNVYCYVNNKASSTILISAHYDHIGLGEYKSLSYQSKGEVHNGADDNASGVALMLSLAKNYPFWSSKKFNYLFVAYSAHEVGLFGSEAFKKFTNRRFSPITLVINFDMVGRLDKRERILSIFGSLSYYGKNNFNTPFQGLNFSTEENEKIILTDAKTFYEANIPSLSFTTGTHLDYHKVSDDEKYINYDGMMLIQNYIENFLRNP